MSQLKYMYNGMPLYIYCMKNNLSYSRIYYKLKTTDKKIEELINDNRNKKDFKKELGMVLNKTNVLEYCLKHNIPYRLVYSRLKYRKWSFEQAISVPKNQYPSTTKHFVIYNNNKLPLKTAIRTFNIDNNLVKTESVKSIMDCCKRGVALQIAFDNYCQKVLQKEMKREF